MLLRTDETARILLFYCLAIINPCQKGMLRFILTPSGQQRILKGSLEEFLKRVSNFISEA